MLKNRYWVQISIILIFAIVLGTFFTIPFIVSVIGLSIGVLSFTILIILSIKNKISLKTFFCISTASVFLFFYSYSSIYCENRTFVEEYREMEVDVFGTIIDRTQNYTDIEISSGELRKGIKIRIYDLEKINDEISLEEFRLCEFKLTLSNCPNYIKAEGISFYAQGYVLSSEKCNKNLLLKSAFYTREYFSSSIDSMFSSSDVTSSFIKALILGEKSDLSDELYSYYGRLGITHIIAVSGLHFTIIVMTIFNVLCRLGIKQKPRSIICILFAIFYCLISGASPSSVRAMIMIIVYLIGKFLLYKTDTLSSICIAATIILTINPFSFYSVSFILSFLATFAISISPELFEIFDLYHKPKIIKKLNKISQSIFITLIITMFIAPTLYSRFQTLSLITPIANLVLSIVFPFIMYISLFSVIISPFGISEIFSKVISKIIEWFHVLVEKAASIKGVSIVPQKQLISIVVIIIIFCVIFALFFKKKHRAFLIKISVFVFIISVIFSVITNIYVLNKYNQIFFSDDGSSALLFREGEIIYIAENEDKIDREFLLNHNVLDIDSFVIKNINDSKNAKKKIDNFYIQFMFDKIYTNSTVLNLKKSNVLSIEDFNCHETKINEKYGIDIIFKNSDNVLWLGDNSRGFNKNESVKKVVFSKGFFDKNQNVVAIPDNVDEFYVPRGIEDFYGFKFIKKNYHNSKIYFLDEFTHKTKVNGID